MASKYERFFWRPKDRVWQYTTDRFPCVTYFGGPQAYLVTPDEVIAQSRTTTDLSLIAHCACLFSGGGDCRWTISWSLLRSFGGAKRHGAIAVWGT